MTNSVEIEIEFKVRDRCGKIRKAATDRQVDRQLYRPMSGNPFARRRLPFDVVVATVWRPLRQALDPTLPRRWR